ncbi:capsular polysaccharide synthesis protein [Azospirillum picis]|uniref:Uncharacterized protein n=1 Tax=Azospirillum picis TaxID=488438 RepID=A0ABU0MST2_9PROT|nr:capsular polysaccharide synthesis protein [Azospirillum picis]MBP2302790.1 hypothetical protein [Azospirillum picis]MDQ0536548.1 hypothetical protein [Azospirillum picis]
MRTSEKRLVRFADYRDRHSGATVVVCGCGRSLLSLTAPDRFLTIGVNDVGRVFDPTYLVVLNPRHQFAADRFRYVEQSRARAIFTQLDLGLTHPDVVRFRLGPHGGTDLSDPETLPHTRNSPYVALCLALHMGARRVGLVGVDFTDHHFFGATGRHPLARELAQIDREYAKLAAHWAPRGVEIVNLGAESRLTALPKCTLESFLDAPGHDRETMIGGKSLEIVSYSTMPVAGVPAILARCIAARTPHRARCVWARNNYGNGVVFDGDIEWNARPGEAMASLDKADLIIVHNGKVDARHASIIHGKPALVMAHNYMWNVDRALIEKGFPGVVIGQYQATLPEFAGWQIVPNPIPFWEAAFRPETKNEVVTVAYTPSGRHESYPEGHRLYWHGKGYATTTGILDDLGKRHGIQVKAIKDRQLSHAEALAAKRAAHIVIDECVTGSYHRNSLEGLACGCVVVNGVGLLPGVTDAFRHCAGDATEVPFVQASRGTLAAVLSELIESGPETLAAKGRRNRAWFEAHWDFQTQWERHWLQAVEQAVDRANRSRRHLPMHKSITEALAVPAAALRIQREQGLSVVIPFSGWRRLGQLATVLATLRQSPAVDQIIVAEMGLAPTALEVARRWETDHLFIASAGPFDKARTINAGSLLARRPEILWCDGDLLFGEDFLVSAQEEFRTQALDFFFPFTRIEYLDEAQSREVQAGTRRPAECRPVRTLSPIRGGAIGGAGLIRASFLHRHGGMIEGFLGWGGEDNAWVHKASLVGRVGATRQANQVAWHLFHAEGGATSQPWRRNPNYTRNVELLGRIQRIRSVAELDRLFPRPAKAPPPWPPQLRIVLVAVADAPRASGLASEWSQRLDKIYECSVAVSEATADGLAAMLDGIAAEVLVVFADGDSAIAAVAAARRDRPVVVVSTGTDPNVAWPSTPDGAAWILARTPEQVAAWHRRGLPVWHRPWETQAGADADKIPTMVQPLSLLLGARPASGEVPVWTYWEGPMPEWIAKCIETMRRHALSLRVIEPRDFEALWDRDRDLDLSRLHVAQRSDFVRAFLLMRFGGLWIDADCIIMRDLTPLLAQLDRFDIIAHRERQGLFSNAFLAARPGSAVAARFYNNLCTRLRARRPLSWIALGNEPLTDVLEGADEPCLELPVEAVQPVCWSRPEVYFQLAEDAEHERRLDPLAWCYMLSQQNVIRHQKSAPGAELLAMDSFFTFLLRCSRNNAGPSVESDRRSGGGSSGNCPCAAVPWRSTITEAFERLCANHAAEGQESVSGPGASLHQTVEVRRALPLLLQHLHARVLLDVPCGDFHWMDRVRLGIETYIGVDPLESLILRNRERHMAPDREFLALDLIGDPLPTADVVLCRDCLVHLSHDDALRVLRNIVDSRSRYVLITTFPDRRENRDVRTGTWRPLNLQAAPFSLPPPLAVINEKCTESCGCFVDKSLGLWRLADVGLALFQSMAGGEGKYK